MAFGISDATPSDENANETMSEVVPFLLLRLPLGGATPIRLTVLLL